MFNKDFPHLSSKPKFDLPQSHRSLSEFKPPTLDSSFFQNFQIKDQQFSKDAEAHIKCQQLLDDQISQRVDKYSPIRTNKPQKKYKTASKYIQWFANSLMQQAYIYRENSFNNFQKIILTERCLEANDQEKNNIFNQIIWDIFFAIFVITVLLIYIPIQVGFYLENPITYGSVLIFIIILDTGTSLYQSYKIHKFHFHQLIDITYLISNTIVLHSSNEAFLIIAVIGSFLCGMIKLEEKIMKQQIYTSLNILPLLRLIQLLLLINFFACSWIFIGRDTWINSLGLEDESNFLQYCHALQWSTATLLNIGQSNISINTEAELIFSSFIMLLSCLIFSYILFLSHSLFKKGQLKKNKQNPFYFRSHLRTMNKFFQNRNFSTQIKSKIRNNILNKKKDQNQQLQQVILEFPKDIREAFQTELRQKSLSNCNVLKNFSIHTQRRLVNVMEYCLYDSNQIITHDEQSLYLIENGLIDVLEYDKVIFSLKTGDYFGELSFFSGISENTKFKISRRSYLYKIKSTDFQKLITLNKPDYERFMFIKDCVLNGKLEILGYYCHSCNSNRHSIKDCPKINYKPNILTLIKKSQTGEMQRSAFNRDRNTNKRINNQVFTRILINQNMIDLIKMKMKISQKDETIEEEVSEEDEEILDQLSDSISPYEFKRDGTTLSQLKALDSINEQNEQAIKQNSNQGTFGVTVQIDQPMQKQFKYGLSLTPFDFPVQTNSLSQLDQYSQSCLSNEGFNKKAQKRPSFQIKKSSPSNNPVESIKINLSKIHEEDSSYLNRKQSVSSPKSKNTPTNQQSRQSSRKFSSKISSIYSSENINYKPSKFSLQAKTNVIIPSVQEVVDLTNFTSNESEEFETMHLFTIYFPYWNYDNVIKRVNNRQDN